MFALLLAEGKITEDVVANMRSWKHSGFKRQMLSSTLSVDQSVRLKVGDSAGVQRLICKERFQNDDLASSLNFHGRGSG